ncbi:MAG TPA: ABC transporter substrate-binding protein [Candidatus Paceibacterota bacterium]|nr:ABC transporter substrate-binding protein [Candidatus Paceibacterota bacterium]HPT18336.1 ABC transporter substrate-binding protein [Candidatus Paceibacterota bacterium]
MFSKRERIILLILVFALTVSAMVILEGLNKKFMVSVPMQGGSISEGIVGSPRFINPILAYSSTDNDLVSLVYSGLTRKNQDGTIIPDLAESYEISKDGLTYTFILKDKIFFQDGEPVTVDDIVFTIEKAKDPLTKSAEKTNWDGVTVQKIDEKTIKFSLKQPFASFLENTTLGILPEHLWVDSPIEINDYNINPIGSGPFQIVNVSKESNGVIKNIELKSFQKFALGKPYIKNITLNFYSNEEELISALLSGNVEQASSITPKNAELLKEKNYVIKSSVLPRVFGLFFNQNQNQIFTNKKIVEAIDLSIDKDRIIKEVFSGYGVAIDEPIPPNMVSYQKQNEKNNSSADENFKKAQEILAKDGWEKGEDGYLKKTTTVKKKKTISTIEFSISTGNTSELVATAEIIRQNLTALGMKVDVKTFEVGNLNQSVIRPRKYDALLFGEIINHESDLYAFWHSSQRKDPGLNVAMYTNAKADKILEDAFTMTNQDAREKKYAQFEDEIKKDMPAVFIYSPNFIYVVSKNLKGVSINTITSSSDRFLNSYLWYINTDNVWEIFSK